MGQGMGRTGLGLIAQSMAALAALAFLASPGAATTLPATTQINGPYTLVGSDSVAISAPPALGSSGATSSGDYFDYLFEFSITENSYVTATVGPVGGSAFSEMHMQFYDNTAPTGPDDRRRDRRESKRPRNCDHPGRDAVSAADLAELFR